MLVTQEDKKLLKEILDHPPIFKSAYSLRKDGKVIERKSSENVVISPKEDGTGMDVIIREETLHESIHIPVILTQSGLKDVVYNDFHIGKNANVVIVAGCGVHNDHHENTEHDGIHRFFLEEGATVKYIEKHYGDGEGTGSRIINPVTEIHLKSGSSLEMESVQIKGVDSTERITKAVLEDNTNLVIVEKIMTHGTQEAKTIFNVELNGENSSVHVTSRSVATDNSIQEFKSDVIGNTKCFGHVECDAIIKDNAKVIAIPKIIANDVDANLIHEAAIGKIAGEQLTKLMTLGLTEKQAEKQIIKGFLK